MQTKPKAKAKAKASARPKAADNVAAPPAACAGDDLETVRQEALALEGQLESELLRDAVLTARMALEELNNDTHGPPYERRRGIRLREKAIKVERAFNRLRALRLGLLLPLIEDE